MLCIVTCIVHMYVRSMHTHARVAMCIDMCTHVHTGRAHVVVCACGCVHLYVYVCGTCALVQPTFVCAHECVVCACVCVAVHSCVHCPCACIPVRLRDMHLSVSRETPRDAGSWKCLGRKLGDPTQRSGFMQCSWERRGAVSRRPT